MKHFLPLLLLAPTAAFAHPGDHSFSAAIHFLTEPDHLAALALALAVVVFGYFRLRGRR